MDAFLVRYKIQENVWSKIAEVIMNILFIYPRMFHPHRGGIERVSDLLCRELDKEKTQGVVFGITFVMNPLEVSKE